MDLFICAFPELIRAPYAGVKCLVGKLKFSHVLYEYLNMEFPVKAHMNKFMKGTYISS